MPTFGNNPFMGPDALSDEDLASMVGASQAAREARSGANAGLNSDQIDAVGASASANYLEDLQSGAVEAPEITRTHNPVTGDKVLTQEQKDKIEAEQNSGAGSFDIGDPGGSYDESSEEHGQKADSMWGQLGDEFTSALEANQKNLQDQMGGVAARGSMNARRGYEMGALQNASGFGGMQAGKQLQGQMATNEFERDLRNQAFEKEMGLRKGYIKAINNKFTMDHNAAIASGNAADLARTQFARDAFQLWASLPDEYRGQFDPSEFGVDPGDEDVG